MTREGKGVRSIIYQSIFSPDGRRNVSRIIASDVDTRGLFRDTYELHARFGQ